MPRLIAFLALAAVALLGVPSPGRAADDVFRLDLKGLQQTPTQTMQLDGAADTINVHGWRYRSYYRPYTFYRPHFYTGFSYYRPSFYYPRYYYNPGYYAYNYGYSYYPRNYGFSFSFGITRPSYYYGYCPISLTLGTTVESTPYSQQLQPQVPPMPALPDAAPSQPTYPYDGGPRQPVAPAPGSEAAPTPRQATPDIYTLGGRATSLPKPAPKYTYPAYGEKPTRTTFAQDRIITVKQP